MSLQSSRQRLAELLAEQALFGLDPKDRDQLNLLLAEHADVDEEECERIAAQLEIAGLKGKPLAQLPDDVERQVRAEMARFAASDSGYVSSADAFGEGVLPASSAEIGTSAANIGVLSLVGVTGWVAAASLFLAVMFPQWFRPPLDSASATSADGPQSVVAQQADRIEIPWSNGGDAWGQGAGGKVVWSNAAQAGYLSLQGLRTNNPDEQQYQLWIVDANRKHPVDGGVFDVPSADEELLIPVEAKLQVEEPTMFAITVERSGGVVVSDQSRLVLVAAVGE